MVMNDYLMAYKCCTLIKHVAEAWFVLATFCIVTRDQTGHRSTSKSILKMSFHGTESSSFSCQKY